MSFFDAIKLGAGFVIGGLFVSATVTMVLAIIMGSIRFLIGPKKDAAK